jgi:hypothetical protein
MQAAIAVRARVPSSLEETQETESILPDELPTAIATIVAKPRALEDIESSFTREQLRAAIVDRTLGDIAAPDAPIDEAPAVTRPQQTDEQLPPAVIHTEPVAPSSAAQAALLYGEDYAAEASDVIVLPSDHTDAEAPPLEVPDTVAATVLLKEIRIFAESPSSAATPVSMSDFSVDEAPPEPSEAPTVPDPDVIRHEQEQEPPSDEPAAGSTVAIAPSSHRGVLMPGAWPPSPPAPTPREEVIDQAVASVISEYVAARGNRQELPADAEHIAELILNLLQQCVKADKGYGVIAAERVPSWKATPTACDLVVRQHAEGDAILRTGILVLTGNRATAIAGYLRRLATEPQPFDRLFLITEEHVGLPLGPRGLEYLKDLQQRSAVQLHTLELSVTEHAELSALRSIVRQARGGTFSVDGDRVTEATVIASHHRQQRYLASHFLSAILFDAPPTELLRQSETSPQQPEE